MYDWVVMILVLMKMYCKLIAKDSIVELLVNKLIAGDKKGMPVFEAEQPMMVACTVEI